GQVEQVLLNLAVNARDAMPQGGRLTIKTRNVPAGEAPAGRGAQPGAHVLLAVSDTGAGRTGEGKARIFEAFFTPQGLGRGTGLGLATVYGIVEQSGGYIEVDSAPGRGATFRIYLPETSEAPTGAKSDPGSQPAPRGTETVLLVEDEAGVRALAGR